MKGNNHFSSSILAGLTIIFLGSLFYSCKKTTQSIDTPPVTGSASVFTFKIDNVAYKVSSEATTAKFDDNSSTSTYQFTSTLGTTDGKQTLYFQQISTSPLIVGKNYDYKAYGNERPIFFYTETGGNSYPIDPNNTTGTIQFTKLERNTGGMVQGTFSFKNMPLNDKDGKLVSYGHNFTEGTFSIIVK